MAKELDETMYVENKQCVSKIDGGVISVLLNNPEQRKTSCYYIYPDDAVLGGC